MTIIVHGLEAMASLSIHQGALAIRFADPAYVRSEQVLVERKSRKVGVVFEHAYHDLGLLPASIDLESLSVAQLSGDAHSLKLSAPVKISS